MEGVASPRRTDIGEGFAGRAAADGYALVCCAGSWRLREAQQCGSTGRRARRRRGGGRLFGLPGKSHPGQGKGVVAAQARRRDKLDRAGSSKARDAPAVHAHDLTPFKLLFRAR